MTQSAVRKLLNMCYDLKRPVKRKFPISLTTRGSLSKPPAMSASRSVTEQR
jgi:LacI family transcriptional regulator